VPVVDRAGRPFAVMSLLNKRGGEAFDARDERALQVFAASIGVILEIWYETSKVRRAHGAMVAREAAGDR
jgi:hypothetical protein